MICIVAVMACQTVGMRVACIWCSLVGTTHPNAEVKLRPRIYLVTRQIPIAQYLGSRINRLRAQAAGNAACNLDESRFV